MCGLRMRPGAGKLVLAEIRSKEHIPEASDTSGWEIAADAVVVPVAADLQVYRRACKVPNSPEKPSGFPADSCRIGVIIKLFRDC